MSACETKEETLIAWLHCACRAAQTICSEPITKGTSRAKHRTISRACLPRGLPRGPSALRWESAIIRTRTSGDRVVRLDRRGGSLEIRNRSECPDGSGVKRPCMMMMMMALELTYNCSLASKNESQRHAIPCRMPDTTTTRAASRSNAYGQHTTPCKQAQCAHNKPSKKQASVCRAQCPTGRRRRGRPSPVGPVGPV